MHTKLKRAIAPPRLGREERRLQTQAALRDSALREFALCGVTGTSAERIAESAGFTRGAFYANYENKQALLLDLIREKVMTEQESWLELADSSLDVEALLEALNDRSLRFDPDDLWTMIAAETYLYALRDDAFAAQYREYYETVRGTFARILGNLFRRAGKRPPLSLDDLADAFLTLNRSPRLPLPDDVGTQWRPFPPEMLMILMRSLLAAAAPVTD